MGANIAHRYLIVIFAIFAVVEASTFNCYECYYSVLDSQYEWCSDEKLNLTQWSLRSCNTSCKKEEFSIEGGRDIYISRSCAHTCIAENDDDIGYGVYCCNTDGCNESNQVTCSIVAMAIVLCAALLFPI